MDPFPSQRLDSVLLLKPQASPCSQDFAAITTPWLPKSHQSRQCGKGPRVGLPCSIIPSPITERVQRQLQRQRQRQQQQEQQNSIASLFEGINLVWIYMTCSLKHVKTTFNCDTISTWNILPDVLTRWRNPQDKTGNHPSCGLSWKLLKHDIDLLTALHRTK